MEYISAWGTFYTNFLCLDFYPKLWIFFIFFCTFKVVRNSYFYCQRKIWRPYAEDSCAVIQGPACGHYHWWNLTDVHFHRMAPPFVTVGWNGLFSPPPTVSVSSVEEFRSEFLWKCSYIGLAMACSCITVTTASSGLEAAASCEQLIDSDVYICIYMSC